MVLESMLNPKNAEDKPLHVLVISFFYSIIAIIIANAMFPSQASILAVAMITIIFMPFFQRMFEIEEEKDEMPKDSIFTRHKKSILAFSAFFIGVVLAMSYVSVFFGFENVFALQKDTISSFTGNIVDNGSFLKFFINNSQVMILTYILSIALGAGAVFILAWNASVVAVFVSNAVNTYILKGFSTAAAYAYGLPLSLGSIALHGVPEIGAYFLAGISGGILSVGIIKEKISGKEFKYVLKDSLIFLGFAEILIFVAAILETII